MQILLVDRTGATHRVSFSENFACWSLFLAIRLAPTEVVEIRQAELLVPRGILIGMLCRPPMLFFRAMGRYIALQLVKLRFFHANHESTRFVVVILFFSAGRDIIAQNAHVRAQNARLNWCRFAFGYREKLRVPVLWRSFYKIFKVVLYVTSLPSEPKIVCLTLVCSKLLLTDSPCFEVCCSAFDEPCEPSTYFLAYLLHYNMKKFKLWDSRL